ncbi:hypothetical protein BGW80DRAFT_1444643 [Lactifluus volemus]|nr:hypothetical protein BGW80DRAFT_1444643 [Lactifluus volemus]
MALVLLCPLKACQALVPRLSGADGTSPLSHITPSFGTLSTPRPITSSLYVTDRKYAVMSSFLQSALRNPNGVISAHLLGIKEKVLGSHRAGASRVILPWANRKDVEHDVPKEYSTTLETCIYPISFIWGTTVYQYGSASLSSPHSGSADQ